VEKLLNVEHLTKYYGKQSVVSDVSFEVKPGSTTLLLGPNGAGKTTIIKCVLGLLRFQGKIEVDGADVSHGGNAARSKIGYLPQQSSYYENLTAFEHARLMATLKGTGPEEIDRYIEMVGLKEYRNRKVKVLSSGMKQRLGLAIALVGSPPLLILDEPTSNIDLQGQMEFKRTLQELTKAGKTFLISTHISGLDTYADQVIVLNSGRIAAKGTPSDVLARINVFDKVYLKVDEADSSAVTEVALEYGEDPNFRDGWLVVSMRPANKAPFVDALIRRRVAVKDIVIEPFSIEEGYVELIGKGGS
jgi:ABC-type multidrug transport system ATPase subunit